MSQGHDDDELPECIVACFHMVKLDLAKDPKPFDFGTETSAATAKQPVPYASTRAKRIPAPMSPAPSAVSAQVKAKEVDGQARSSPSTTPIASSPDANSHSISFSEFDDDDLFFDADDDFYDAEE